MTRLYIAGPMTGLPDWNFPAFNEAAEQLRAAGYEVENPAVYGEGDWTECMKRDIPLLLACDGVALLEWWGTSKGAKLEVRIARDLGMPIMSTRLWAIDAKYWAVA